MKSGQGPRSVGLLKLTGLRAAGTVGRGPLAVNRAQRADRIRINARANLYRPVPSWPLIAGRWPWAMVRPARPAGRYPWAVGRPAGGRDPVPAGGRDPAMVHVCDPLAVVCDPLALGRGPWAMVRGPWAQ